MRISEAPAKHPGAETPMLLQIRDLPETSR